MPPGVVVLAALAGGLGAAVRYLVDVGVSALSSPRFPWGILVVNITGSFALGAVTGALPAAAFVLGAGYTTFSTAMLDAVALWRDGARGAALFDAFGMLALCLAAALCGLALGHALAA